MFLCQLLVLDYSKWGCIYQLTELRYRSPAKVQISMQIKGYKTKKTTLFIMIAYLQIEKAVIAIYHIIPQRIYCCQFLFTYSI